MIFNGFLDIHSFNFPGGNPDLEHVFLVTFLSQTLGSLSSKMTSWNLLRLSMFSMAGTEGERGRVVVGS